LSVRCVIS